MSLGGGSNVPQPPSCPPLPTSIPSVCPSIPSVRPSIPSPSIPHPPAPPAVCPSVLPSALPSDTPSPRTPFFRRALLQPSRPRHRSPWPGRPSPWPGRPSPWHLGRGIPGAGICRAGGAGAAEAERQERPQEVEDGRQGMSIVHHRSRPGLTAPLGSGGGGGPGRPPRLLGPGLGGRDWPLAPRAAPHSCVGSGCSWRKAKGHLRGWQVPGWHCCPAGMGIPLGWASHQYRHPPGTSTPLG